MFTKRQFLWTMPLAVAMLAAGCGGEDSAGLSPTSFSSSTSQASNSGLATLTAEQNETVAAACGFLHNGDGVTVTIGGPPPPGAPPPTTVVGGEPGRGGGLGQGPPGPPPAGADVALFGGSVDQVTGSCPSITFTIFGNVVHTNGSTAFGDGSCASLKAGDQVGVVGTAQTDGSVLASCVATGI